MIMEPGRPDTLKTGGRSGNLRLAANFVPQAPDSNEHPYTPAAQYRQRAAPTHYPELIMEKVGF
jgi:hypothetical protein